MAQQDDGLLREVEEELRRERLEKLWTQYGTYILGAAVAVVLGVLLYKFWEQRQISAAQDSGAHYEEALSLINDKKEGSAEAEFSKLAADSYGGYGALARLQAAGILAKQGKTAEALANYDALAADNRADQMLREYARLQAAGLRIGEADFTEIENRLTPLMDDEAPWRFSARELLGLAAFKAGKFTDARAVLTPLFVDQSVPQSIVERAQIIMAEIAAAEIAKKSAAAPAPTTPAAAVDAGSSATPPKKD